MSYRSPEGERSRVESKSKKSPNLLLSRNSKLFGTVLAISAAISTYCGDTMLKDSSADAAVARSGDGMKQPANPDMNGAGPNGAGLPGERNAANSAESQFKDIMPTIKDTGENFVFGVPADIKMEKVEFEAFMKPIIEKVKGLAAKVKADMSKPGADRANIVRQFVYAIEAEVKKNPKGKDYMSTMQSDNKFGGDGEYCVKLADRMSKLFLADGYVLNVGFYAIQDEATGEIAPYPEIKFAPIERVKKYEVGDKEGTLEAPFIELGIPVIYEARDDASAFWIPNLDAVVYFKANSAAKQKKQYEELNSFGFNPKKISREEFERANDRDTVLHELTHWLLSKRFPTISKAIGSNITMTIDIKLPLPGNKYADFSGKMHPLNLHELCAVGSELYHSDAMPPNSLYRYVNMGRTADPSSGYQLVSAIVPYQAMMTAPDSPRKKALLNAATSGGQINTMEINKLIRDTYSLNDIHRLGGEVYRLCLDKIRIGEKVTIDLINNNPQLR